MKKAYAVIHSMHGILKTAQAEKLCAEYDRQIPINYEFTTGAKASTDLEIVNNEPVSKSVKNDVEDMIELREYVDSHTDEDTVGSIVNILCQEQEIMDETRSRTVIKDWLEETGFLEHTLSVLADNNPNKILQSINALHGEEEERKAHQEA